MSFDGLLNDTLIQRCASAEAEARVLRARLDLCERKLAALEVVKTKPGPVRWNSPSIMVPPLQTAIQQGYIDIFSARLAVTDDERRYNFRSDEMNTERIADYILREVRKYIKVLPNEYNKRVGVTVYEAQLIVGELQ